MLSCDPVEDRITEVVLDDVVVILVITEVVLDGGVVVMAAVTIEHHEQLPVSGLVFGIASLGIVGQVAIGTLDDKQ